MSGTGVKRPKAPRGDRAPRDISASLHARRAELEQAALTRVYAIAEPIESADPEYVEGLRLAVSAALDYALAAIDGGADGTPPVPASLLAQARLAARNGVSLDTVLRRYFAGYTLFGDFLVQAAEGTLRGAELKALLGAQATLFDQLVVAVSEEYGRESARRLRSPEERRVKHVKRLLAGELFDASELAYEVEGWHLGVVGIGGEAEEALGELARELDRNLLVVRPGGVSIWAWLGGRRQISGEVLAEHARAGRRGALLAIGEPGQGLTGWRLTHHQALAALPIAQRGRERVVRYADVGLLASTLQDRVLSSWLRQRYFPIFEEDGDGEAVLRDTLRVYLESGRNVSSTAARLKTSRRTVTNRLRTIERQVGRSLDTTTGDIELALCLFEFEQAQRSQDAAQTVPEDLLSVTQW